ncbi:MULTISPECIES: hypothetical protein [unclassified Nocardia]|uniref:hypothetical protein n=1 Tax=unclassified Nocardia TaxID=2637762 RepID=UPI0027DEBB88|nr:MULTISPECIES: hypothetical protein [unclassified Nocardia]
MPIRLTTPSAAPYISGILLDTPNRRSVLRLFGATAAGSLAVGAASGCVREDPVHDPDPLAAQEVLARADADAAKAAIALAPQRAAALTTIAAERSAHADALRAEIDRVIGVYGDGTIPVHRTRSMEPGSTGGASASGTSGTPVPPTPPPSVDALRDRLNRARQSAADLARTQTGYRAGLLASISAACAAQAGVLLA